MARDIFRDVDSEPLIALCVLKGGYKFFADLCDKIQAICRNSNKSMQLSVDFIRLKSYVVGRPITTVDVPGIRYNVTIVLALTLAPHGQS